MVESKEEKTGKYNEPKEYTTLKTRLDAMKEDFKPKKPDALLA